MMDVKKKLQTAHFDFSQSFQLSLPDGAMLDAQKPVRILPRKRMVVLGLWRDQQGEEKAVAAKIFFDAKRAKRHYTQEMQGIQAMLENNIPTPPVYYHGETCMQGVYVIITRELAEAKTLATIWQHKRDVIEVMPLLNKIMLELATQHVLGIVHTDLHLKNFLVTKRIIYTLDGDAIVRYPYLVPKKLSVHHVALFIAQLGALNQEHQLNLFKRYANARGWRIKAEDKKTFFTLIKKTQTKRWHDYAKKIMRTSTQFKFTNRWTERSCVDRAYLGPEMQKVLRDPAAIFSQPHAVLKAGRSATVIKITLDGRVYAIKRYNLKNHWHRLRRLLRVTRAVKVWRLSQKLALFDIATPKPVAFIEKRTLCFHGESYYIAEYIAGNNALDFFKAHQQDVVLIKCVLRHIVVLLKSLRQINMTHGDLKITNIIVHYEKGQDQPYLIDLDGAKEHTSPACLRMAWRKEWARFLKNFTTMLE